MLKTFLNTLLSLFKSRQTLVLENAALRHQLGGRTARVTFGEGAASLPDRRLFREAMELREKKLLSLATSGKEMRNARRLAIEQTLLCYRLMKIEGEV